MKKYLSLGELLIDYRAINNISLAELAARLNVDIRTVMRWEKDETLIKSEKEEEIVEETFIPYQVIRNLNATVAIPTFYDFRLRKYSTDELSNKLPLADWIKTNMDYSTNRIRTVEFKSDFDNILRYAQIQSPTSKPVSRELLQAAVNKLPELNKVLSDLSGYYSGHLVFFPLKHEVYQKLKNREIVEGDLTTDDLTNYKTERTPIFHLFDISADSNENVFYLAGEMLKFFRNINTDYICSSYTTRSDTYEINKAFGSKLIWEDKEKQNKLGLAAPPRFYEGNFNQFLSDK